MINLLSSLGALRSNPAPEPCVIMLETREIKLSFKRNARCRRMILRVAKDGSGLVMTLPKRTSQVEALRFAHASKGWILKNLAGRQAPVAFADGMTIPYRGVSHLVQATGGKRGLVHVGAESRTIAVPGDAAHLPRRLGDWLKKQAVIELTAASQNYAAAMNLKFTKLSVRDQNSRWGSCSAGGALSYSWRLILAPPEVLDYVAAHEVAHLAEMNHGSRFWRLVLSHCKHANKARRWLREHGGDLHRYGAA